MNSVQVPGECSVCGHPGLRPEGHAEWCARVTFLLLTGRHLRLIDIPADLDCDDLEFLSALAS